jgi:hypothetical protein
MRRIAWRTAYDYDAIATLKRVALNRSFDRADHLDGITEVIRSLPLNGIDGRVCCPERNHHMGILEVDPFNGSFDGRVLVSQKIRMRVVGVYRRAEQKDDRYR